MKLPGIGPSRARAILALRQRLAKFRAVEDLLRVKGIGRKTLRRIKPNVVLDRPVAPEARQTSPRTSDLLQQNGPGWRAAPIVRAPMTELHRGRSRIDSWSLSRCWRGAGRPSRCQRRRCRRQAPWPPPPSLVDAGAPEGGFTVSEADGGSRLTKPACRRPSVPTGCCSSTPAIARISSADASTKSTARKTRSPSATNTPPPSSAWSKSSGDAFASTSTSTPTRKALIPRGWCLGTTRRPRARRSARRLCFESEWVSACEGPDEDAVPLRVFARQQQVQHRQHLDQAAARRDMYGRDRRDAAAKSFPGSIKACPRGRWPNA